MRPLAPLDFILSLNKSTSGLGLYKYQTNKKHLLYCSSVLATGWSLCLLSTSTALRCDLWSSKDNITEFLIIKGIASVGIIHTKEVFKVPAIDNNSHFGNCFLECREIDFSWVRDVEELKRLYEELFLWLVGGTFLRKLLLELLFKSDK